MAEEKRPEWMTNISSIVDPDEYLLGRKIDKTFELAQKEKADKAREARIELLAKDKIKLSHDPIVDLERRKKQLKMELIQNPVLMKQFRDKLLKGELGSNKAGQSSSDMSGFNRKKGKVQVHGAKPEVPAFIQRMKEQLVAKEDQERIERSEKRRRERSGKTDHEDDDPTIVKLKSDDLTEAEYKRMKKELDTQYTIPATDEHKKHKSIEDLDIDHFIKSDRCYKSRSRGDDSVASSSKARDHRSEDSEKRSTRMTSSHESSRRHESSKRHERSRGHESSKGHDDVKRYERSRDHESSRRHNSSKSHKPSSSHRKVLTYGSSSEESD